MEKEMLLKNCPKCGSRLSEQTAVCPTCGYRFSEKKRNAGKEARIRKHFPSFLLISVLIIILFAMQRFYSAAGREHLPTQSNTMAETFAVNTATSGISYVPQELLGSYEGEDGSGLTFYADGTAVYYTEPEEYSDVGDPWSYENGQISVELAKLHCIIKADASDGFSFLYFCSDSQNWVNEKFQKLPREEKKYLSAALHSDHKAVTVLESGSFDVSFHGLSLLIPRHFYNSSSAFGAYENAAIFGDTNADIPYLGGLAFAYEEFHAVSVDDWFDGHANAFAKRFLDNVQILSWETQTIAGVTIYIANVKGEFNRVAGGASGRSANGFVAFYINPSAETALKVIMEQLETPVFDNRPEFQAILHSIRVSNADWLSTT